MSVYLERLNQDTHVPTGSVLEFNRIRVNLGDGYDIQTGSFTTPVNGIYFFTLSFMSADTKHANLALYVNDERLCVTFARSTNNVATCSAMTELKVGDVVNVKGIQAGVDGNLYQSDYVYRNHHSLVGFLYKSL